MSYALSAKMPVNAAPIEMRITRLVFRSLLESVSYTHLASYIEKVKEVGANVTFEDFSLMNPVVLVGLFIGACPVSYTHLDVYKRQG